MNSIFGDATTIAPTPDTIAEAESFLSGNRSPIPSLRLGENGEQISEMDIQPPDIEIRDGKPLTSKDANGENEGVGGWISGLISRSESDDSHGGGSGNYRRVDQDDQEQE